MENSNMEPDDKDFQSDFSVLTMIMDGKFSRNKNFDFFKTDKGKEILRKAKMLKGVINDMKNGAKITDEKKQDEQIKITIENDIDKYRRIIYMNTAMYSVFEKYKDKR